MRQCLAQFAHLTYPCATPGTLHRLARGRQALDSELETKLPYVLSTGGYIPTCDHMVPPDVSWADFCYYRERVRDYVDEYRLVV